MKRSRLLLSILTSLVLLGTTSCADKKSSSSSNNTTSSTSPSTPSNPTTTPTLPPIPSGNDPDAPGVSDGNQTDNYYTLANIRVHGRAHFTDYNSTLNPGNPNYMTNPSSSVYWSSSSGISSSDQNIFMTNSRFNVRIVPRDAEHGANVLDWSGNSANRCYRHSTYTKLQLTLCVRKQNGGCIYQHTFDAKNNEASKVKEFNFPDTAEPLIVEVLNVKSDYNCAATGYQSYCSYGGHDHPACVKFDIQFSTDQTKDLPGTRY